MSVEILTDTARITGAFAGIVIAIGIITKAVIGVYRIARRIDLTNQLVQKELTPNGGSSLRDAVDRIEVKADQAVARAEEAAQHAQVAATLAASALDRIEAPPAS